MASTSPFPSLLFPSSFLLFSSLFHLLLSVSIPPRVSSLPNPKIVRSPLLAKLARWISLSRAQVQRGAGLCTSENLFRGLEYPIVNDRRSLVTRLIVDAVNRGELGSKESRGSERYLYCWMVGHDFVSRLVSPNRACIPSNDTSLFRLLFCLFLFASLSLSLFQSLAQSMSVSRSAGRRTAERRRRRRRRLLVRYSLPSLCVSGKRVTR